MIVLALNTQHQIKLNTSSIFFLENVVANLQNWIFKWDIDSLQNFSRESGKDWGKLKSHLSKSPLTTHHTPHLL